MKTNAVLISALAGILIFSTVGMLAENSDAGTKALTSHGPIYINGNNNFTSANGVSSGSGTQTDPYIKIFLQSLFIYTNSQLINQEDNRNEESNNRNSYLLYNRS